MLIFLELASKINIVITRNEMDAGFQGLRLFVFDPE